MERQVYLKNVENVQSFHVQVSYGCAINIYATEVCFLSFALFRIWAPQDAARIFFLFFSFSFFLSSFFQPAKFQIRLVTWCTLPPHMPALYMTSQIQIAEVAALFLFFFFFFSLSLFPVLTNYRLKIDWKVSCVFYYYYFFNSNLKKFLLT